jgi:RNA recognition motif-containing protein
MTTSPADFSGISPLLSLSPFRLGGPPRFGPFRIDPESIAGSVNVLRGVRTVGKKLYVGNLSYSVTNASLEEMFSQFGQVRSAEVIQDRDTGRSKGFGFVEMADDNGAREAINGLHEKEHDGRALTVNEARPREERGGSRGGGGGVTKKLVISPKDQYRSAFQALRFFCAQPQQPLSPRDFRC